jgi:GR25 family glycosyltransferase involved in LPS biosynthesis
MDFNIFVITIDNDRFKKYEYDKIYKKWNGCIGKNLTNEFVDNTYITMWNANRIHKHNVAGCCESHLNLMKHIIDNNINKSIILEDDSILDISRLEELNNINDFCYIGGRFQPPKLSDKLNIDKSLFIKGLNTIDPNIFTITGSHGYYFPNVDITRKIYNNIINKTKRRAIDSECRILQKKKIINYFIYPAISILHLEHARNGFTYNNNSKYKLIDNNYNY